MKMHRRLIWLMVCIAMVFVPMGALASEVTPAKVVKAKTMSLNYAARTRYISTVANDPLNTWDSFDLVPRISPKSATALTDPALISYKVDKPHIASVDALGNVTAHAKGTAKVTVTLLDGSKKKSTCTVTVRDLTAKAVDVEPFDKDLQLGENVQMVPIITPATVKNKGVTYSSNNNKVCKVTKNGVLKPVGVGTAKITVRSKGDTKKFKTIKVTVGYKYRLYSIGNGLYKDDDFVLECWKYDMKSITDIYKNAKFGKSTVRVSQKPNATSTVITKYLDTIASADIRDNDVTFFYYTGHGVGPGFSEAFRGALVGVNYNFSTGNTAALVTVDTMVDKLSKVKGDVVVILDYCFSGTFISKSVTGEMKAQQLKLFNERVTNAFANASSKSTMTSKGVAGGTSGGARFHVITASAWSEESFAATGTGNGIGDRPWSVNQSRSLFTFKMLEATFGTSRIKMAADKNGDKQVTMKELYDYTKDEVQKILDSDKYVKRVQTVQLWPANDDFVMYAQKP